MPNKSLHQTSYRYAQLAGEVRVSPLRLERYMKDKVIQYYENTRQYYGTYHNHKEVSAWAGLALYVLFTGLVNWISLPDKYKIASVHILTAFVIFVSILVYF